jgi:hypothetical protein
MRTTVALLVFALGSAAPALSPGAPLPPKYVPPSISIVSGTYGGNCQRPTGNVTAPLAAACNGKTSCDYVVDYHAIGDPAFGCAKDYVAVWQCGAGSPQQSVRAAPEAGYGSQLHLSCLAAMGSGVSPPAPAPPPPPAPPSPVPALGGFAPCHANSASFLELSNNQCSGRPGQILTLYVSRYGLKARPAQAVFMAGPIGARLNQGRQPYGAAKLIQPLTPFSGDGLTPGSAYTVQIPAGACLTGPGNDYAFDVFVPIGGANQDIDSVLVIC